LRRLGYALAHRCFSPHALRDRVLFSLVSNGASEEIAGVDADIASHTWHTLAVRTKDDEFVVS
jgi:hypothetical protein